MHNLQKYLRRSHWPYIALGVGILSLGFSAIFVRWANAPAAITNFYRMGIATILLAWPFARRVRARRALPRRGVWFAIWGGLFFAADLALWTAGVNIGGATIPTLLANTAPVWVGLGSLVFFREKLNIGFWLGLLLALAGAGIILGLDNPNASLGMGGLLGLLAGAFYGSYFLLTQRGRETLDSLTYFWPSAVTSTLGMLMLGLVLRQPFTGYSLRTYFSFLGLGLITQVAGYLAINEALGQLPATIVAPTLLGQPVMTAILAVPLLGESLSAGQTIGGFAVLTGVYIVHRSQTEQKGRT